MKFLACFAAIAFHLCFILSVNADVVLDGTVGPAGSVPGPDYRITDDLGRREGGNLFHSFRTFDIATGESAVFSGPSDVARVIGRVSGGAASFIDGVLRSEIPGADLFLVNPAGLIFGQNAALDIGGAFFAGTADHIRLADGGRFDAATPEASVFTSAPPAAFGFLDDAAGPVTLSGEMTVLGNDFTLTGGDIAIDGGFIGVADGDIRIGAVASAGEITISDFEFQGFDALGNITVSNLARVRGEVDRTGGIKIKGGRFVIDQAGVTLMNYGTGEGGKVDVDVDEATVKGGGLLMAGSAGAGRGGDLTVTTGSLDITDGGWVAVAAYGDGDAGNLEIQADDAIHIAGAGNNGYSLIMNHSEETGATGDIRISTGSLTLANEGRILNTAGGGNRGRIDVKADSVTLESDARFIGGDIDISAETIDISEGGHIWSYSSRRDEIRTINIEATAAVSIIGENEKEYPWRGNTDPIYTGIFTDIFYNADGLGGDISVSAPDITITDSGQISARTYTNGPAGDVTVSADRLTFLNGGQISVSSEGSSITEGPAGNVTVTAGESVSISGVNGELVSGILSTTRSDAGAGLIEVTTPLLAIRDTGRINVRTGIFGKGDAGRIHIFADRIELTDRGGISAASNGEGLEGIIRILADEGILIREGFIDSNGDGGGAAGDIEIVTPFLHLDRGVIAAVTRGERDGGSLLISAGRVRLENGSEMTCRSEGFGDAGTIRITAEDEIFLSASDITTETEQSDGGNIDIQAANLIHLRESDITATVAGGAGNGGNITIDPTFVILDHSRIIANAFEGNGGNIRIIADYLIQDPYSIIEASSEKGIDGIVDIDAPDTDLSGNLVVLPTVFLDASDLLSDRCGIRTRADASTLTVPGFTGPPVAPEDPF